MSEKRNHLELALANAYFAIDSISGTVEHMIREKSTDDFIKGQADRAIKECEAAKASVASSFMYYIKYGGEK